MPRPVIQRLPARRASRSGASPGIVATRRDGVRRQVDPVEGLVAVADHPGGGPGEDHVRRPVADRHACDDLARRRRDADDACTLVVRDPDGAAADPDVVRGRGRDVDATSHASRRRLDPVQRRRGVERPDRAVARGDRDHRPVEANGRPELAGLRVQADDARLLLAGDPGGGAVECERLRRPERAGAGARFQGGRPGQTGAAGRGRGDECRADHE